MPPGSGGPQTTRGPEDSSSSTGATSDEGDASTGAPQPDPVPVFVALGDGGWIATSCDRGRTFAWQEFSDQRGDHSEWTAFGGLVFGPSGFVGGLGWGSDGGHILHSEDGVRWTDLPDPSFVDDGEVTGYPHWTAAVAHDGEGYLAFSRSRWRSTDGTSWQTVDISLPPGAEQLRQLRSFPDRGLLVASVESQSGNHHPQGNFVLVSDDGGQTWNEGTGYDTSCSHPIQHRGDIELMGDTLVVATRNLCRSTDLGQSWTMVEDPTGSDMRDVFGADGRWWAAAGDAMWSSPDALQWEQQGTLPGTPHMAAFADGSFVAISARGEQVFYSDDGGTWSQGRYTEPPSETRVRDLAVGWLPEACSLD